MALTATIFRVELDVADVDRGVYLQEQHRLALHPSEEPERLVARLLAYTLLWEDGLVFAKDLNDVDEPALWRHDDLGQLAHWVEVGAPTARRLHIRSKASPRLSVVVYKGSDDGRDALRRELQREGRVHRADAIEVITLPGVMVSEIAEAMSRSSALTVIRTGDTLQVLVDGVSFDGTLREGSLQSLLG
ncbi:MAG: hypothetical protein RIT45_1272 [Pseudomonadota bacterium]